MLGYDPENLNSLITGSINTSSSTLSSGIADSNFSQVTSASVTSDFIKRSQSSCIHQIDQDKEKFLHQNCTSVPSFFLCVNCGGNFAFQYINSTTNIGSHTDIQSARINAQHLKGNIKLCSCLLNSAGSANNLPKSHSADQLMTFRRETEIIETANSHTGIPNHIDSSIEAALDLKERCESGF